jgi:geranylgeranyl reductase family protein
VSGRRIDGGGNPLVHDVIVVGAGPGGSMAARRCAEAGLDVLLLDRCAFPREKPCGGIARPGVIDLVGGGAERVVEAHVRTCRLLLNMRHVIDYRDHTVLFKRSRFDALLVDLAEEAGATFRESARVVTVDTGAPDRAEVVLEDGERIAGRCVVGADGPYSAVARSSGLVTRPLAGRQGNFALYFETELPDHEVDAILGPPEELRRASYFFEGLHGMGWVFRKEGCVNVGIGVGSMGPSDIRRRAERFLDELGMGRFKHALRGRHIPCGFLPRVTSDRVLLVGDAAGAGNPMTGCGVEDALKTGVIAARTVVQVLSGGLEPTAARLEAYERSLRTLRRIQSTRGTLLKGIWWAQRRGWASERWMRWSLEAMARLRLETFVWTDAARF